MTRLSEKGRYLTGVVELFGGLDSACSTLGKSYWRRMFNLLSNRKAHIETHRLEEVTNLLRKRLQANRIDLCTDETAVNWLAQQVLKLARLLPTSSRELEFRVFEDEARREVEDFNSNHPAAEPWGYSHRGLMNDLNHLTELGVLLMGLQARCPHCGYRAWHHIDDVKQTIRCVGCNYTYPLPPERRWYYRLNSLARAATADHGLVPVILVLGQLLMEARSSFLFAPCLDLFEKETDGPVGDIDIAVVIDGQFVIGEVKQSRDLFRPATFGKLEEVARRLMPDRLLFASMDRKPSTLIAGEIGRLSRVLAPLQIEVQWYALHEHNFEPSPVR
jgi:hypothetical protein